tara:strand:- start:13832 stop:14347 length:516 start_codon:yes stop_codon:yes gene_type:complete
MKLEVHYIKGDIIMKSVKAEMLDPSQTKYCHSWLNGKKVAEYLKTGNMNDIASKVCDIHYDNRKEDAIVMEKTSYGENFLWRFIKCKQSKINEMDEISEIVFTFMNGMYKNGQDHPLLYGKENKLMLDRLGLIHSSMSVSDFILFPNKEIMVCDGDGWLKINVNKHGNIRK